MKLELIIFGATSFLLYNAYHDGKYTKVFYSYKKYYKMATIGLLGISLYLLMKRNPDKSKQMLLYTNNLIKYMPIDKSTVDMISPIFDFTTKGDNSFMGGLNGVNIQNQNPVLAAQQQRMALSGQKTTKRSVSETKKKYVASIQDWKCGHCSHKLTHTFEIDHKIRLEHGGGNDPSNLVALCRECHGQKTASENM